MGQKAYEVIIPESYLSFSQIGSCFIQNHKLNPIKSNLKKYVKPGVLGGLEHRFGPLVPKKLIKPYVQNQFSQTGLVLPKIIR